LIQVVQGAAVMTLVLNLVAVWRQEFIHNSVEVNGLEQKDGFLLTWKRFIEERRISSLIWVVFLGTLAFAMQDVLLEPYGGQILGLSVSATTLLTGLWAFGSLLGLAIAARKATRVKSPISNTMKALLVGIVGFSAIIFSSPMQIPLLYFIGTTLIGLGTGLFSVSLLTLAMSFSSDDRVGRGLILGSWGAAQALGAGLGIAIGGILRDIINQLALSGVFGKTFESDATGYLFVYHLEILIIFITLISLGSLSQELKKKQIDNNKETRFGLAEIPS